MDRVITYVGQIPLDTHVLQTNKNTMIGLSKLAHAMMGDGPWLRGLGCGPTGPASLQVVVQPGQIYMIENLDGTAYGSLAADTTHQILKQGILLDAVTLSCPAPGTAGQSINYLIEVGYLDTDGGSTVLPYYNSSNPAQAYNGPNNTGTSQNTVRQGVCSVQVKAGTAAATGTQTTPAADAGYIGAWVVTVANGQATITAANISMYAGAPFLAPAAANGATTISSSVTLGAGSSGIHGLLSGVGTAVTLWTPVGNVFTRAKFTGIDGNTQTISTPAGVIYLPDGTSSASVTVTNGQSVDLVADGTNWRMVATSTGLARIGGTNAFTGANTFPTPAVADNSTAAATTAFVRNVLGQIPSGNYQLFPSNGNFTAQQAGNYLVMAKGAGGGGGGGKSVTTTSLGEGGQGGEDGQLVVAVVTLTAAQVVAVTPGTKGSGGASATNGTAGTASTFGGLVSAAGGNLGVAGQALYAGAGGGNGPNGASGIGSGGGQGGAGTTDATGTAGGAAATNSGAGGGGGGGPRSSAGGSFNGGAGGNGADGWVLVIW